MHWHLKNQINAYILLQNSSGLYSTAESQTEEAYTSIRALTPTVYCPDSKLVIVTMFYAENVHSSNLFLWLFREVFSVAKVSIAQRDRVRLRQTTMELGSTIINNLQSKMHHLRKQIFVSSNRPVSQERNRTNRGSRPTGHKRPCGWLHILYMWHRGPQHLA
jgi:hypothetical protein